VLPHPEVERQLHVRKVDFLVHASTVVRPGALRSRRAHRANVGLVAFFSWSGNCRALATSKCP
jgi:hypothetical protein